MMGVITVKLRLPIFKVKIEASEVNKGTLMKGIAIHRAINYITEQTYPKSSYVTPSLTLTELIVDAP